MDIFIDFEGYNLKNDTEFIIKELASIKLDKKLNKKMEYHLFDAPHDWDSLSARDKTSVMWSMRHDHVIPWGIGRVSYQHVDRIFSEMLMDVRYIFVNDWDKKEILEQLIGYSYPIISLSVFQYSRHGEDVDLNPCSYQCHYSCASKRVQVMVQWFKSSC